MLKSSSTRNDSNKLYQECVTASHGGKVHEYKRAGCEILVQGQRSRSPIQKLGIVGLVGGGVGMVAGVTFLILPDINPEQSRQISPSRSTCRT